MKTIVGNNITKAIEFLNNGDVIAMPTETVYGFAANALDAAVRSSPIANNRLRPHPMTPRSLDGPSLRA